MRLTKKERKALRRERKRAKKAYRSTSATFLASYEWRSVRMQVLKRDGARCACCGATPADGVRVHVDHIKPRLTFPHLALDLNNLQVLCEVCNHGKGNWDQTNWRGPVLGQADSEQERQQEHLDAIRNERIRVVK